MAINLWAIGLAGGLVTSAVSGYKLWEQNKEITYKKPNSTPLDTNEEIQEEYDEDEDDL